MTRTSAILRAFVLSFVTLCVVAAPSTPSTQDQVQRGVITGRIFDRDTNHPISGVTLRLSPLGASESTQQITDSTGQYLFEHLPMGSYALSVARLGYHPIDLEIMVNRTDPVVVSVGIVPRPIPLPDVSVDAPPTTPQPRRGTPSVISRRNTIEASEIEERGVFSQDLYAVLIRLRPGWLTQRGEARILGQPNPIVLYVDNVRRGTVDDLRSIYAGMVARVHFFDALGATQEWGTGHVNGAIHVILKPPAR